MKYLNILLYVQSLIVFYIIIIKSSTINNYADTLSKFNDKLIDYLIVTENECIVVDNVTLSGLCDCGPNCREIQNTMFIGFYNVQQNKTYYTIKSNNTALHNKPNILTELYKCSDQFKLDDFKIDSKLKCSIHFNHLYLDPFRNYFKLFVIIVITCFCLNTIIFLILAMVSYIYNEDNFCDDIIPLYLYFCFLSVCIFSFLILIIVIARHIVSYMIVYIISSCIVLADMYMLGNLCCPPIKNYINDAIANILE